MAHPPRDPAGGAPQTAPRQPAGRGPPGRPPRPDVVGPGRRGRVAQSSEESTEVTFGSMGTPGPKVVATVALEM